MATEVNSITKSLKNLILVGQIFGYFPVQDISKSVQKFSFFSLRVLYSIFSFIGSLFLCVMQINKASTLDVGIEQMAYVLAYISTAYGAVVFIELARQWPQLMVKWSSVEKKMKNYGFPRNLNKRIIVLIIILMSGFAVQFILHQATRIYRVIECHENPESSVKFFFGNLTLSHVFTHITYNLPTGLAFQFWFLQCEFVFTYTDLFIIIISICLSSRLEQVTKKIKVSCKKQVTDKEIWRQLRNDYTRLGALCDRVNCAIANIILMSFLPNTFLLLAQVFRSLKPKQNYLETVYFYFCLLFLVSKMVTVCMCGAMVNEESRKPLTMLNSVPHHVYNDEIEIFINQILNFEISLNGKHFFDIKRYVVLEIAAAIVTYELVIIQFNQDSLKTSSKSTRCS